MYIYLRISHYVIHEAILTSVTSPSGDAFTLILKQNHTLLSDFPFELSQEII